MLQIKPCSYIVKQENEPFFSEFATVVSIDDEGDGPFIVIEQEPAAGKQKVTFNFDEWQFVNQAVSELKSRWEE